MFHGNVRGSRFGTSFAISNDGEVTAPPTPLSEPEGSDPSHLHAPFVDPRAPEPQSRRAMVMSAAGLLTSVLVAVLTILPAHFAIGGPGPTFDTLGTDDDGTPLVSIEGAPIFESSGELRLTTVSVSRGSSEPFTMGSVLRGYFSPHQYVLPEIYVFGNPEDEAQHDKQAKQDWITSQESATVSALEQLGMPVPASIRVAGIEEDSHARGLLEVDDVLVAIDGTPITTYAQMSAAIEAHQPGDIIKMTVQRGTQQVTESFTALDDGGGNAIIGIWIDPTFEIPIDVSVQIDRVGGPSAGLMFSLGIMDKLTPQDELAGRDVAGTGTIDANGDVGPIGGIQFKMEGARQAGAEYFLAPVENCQDVLGHVPGGLSVFSVDDLDDAYAAVVNIGAGDTSELPTC